MSREARKKKDPIVKPVKSIEVSDDNRKRKLILIIVLLALGVTLIVVSASRFLTVPAGWETIQVSTDMSETCAGDFVFQYLLGDGRQAANREKVAITEIYTNATQTAFQIFHESRLFDGVHNVAYLNQHVNEEVEVPGALYNAFALLDKYDNKALYLAPIYQEYVGMFASDEDWIAKDYDPEQNGEQAAYFAEILAFTTNENAVKLELLGNNKVKLSASSEYQQYAKTHEIANFINFYWMKNAFIVDYLAEQLTNAGYTKGSISSFDGFARNMDDTDRRYQLNVFDRVERSIYQAGVLNYTGSLSMVSLRNYPTSSLAVQQYHQWDDGSYTSCHIDPVDGRSKSAINDMIGYGRDVTCSEILLKLYPVYVTENFDVETLGTITGVNAIYCKDYTIYTNGAAAEITQLYKKGNIEYTWQKTE